MTFTLLFVEGYNQIEDQYSKCNHMTNGFSILTWNKYEFFMFSLFLSVIWKKYSNVL